MRKKTTNGKDTAEKKKYPLIYSIVINLIALVVFLLLFEPTTKSDDYDMANVLYGGINGEYCPFILYSHVFLGYFMVFLLKLFPSVSWFFVLQYVAIILSFVTVGYIVYSNNSKKTATVIMCCFLVLADYEFLIRLTFSKTAGALLGCGFAFLLYLIVKGERLNLRYLWGIFLVTMGILVRNQMSEMVLCIFVSSFVITCITGVEDKDSDCIRKIIYFVCIAILIFLEGKILWNVNSKIYNEDETWGNYLVENSTRASLVDYGIPDYNTYEEAYEELGVNENDLYVWFTLADRDDPNILTYELYSQIRGIYTFSSDESLSDIISQAFKNLLNYEATNEMFYLLLLCGILFLLLSTDKHKVCVSVCVVTFMIVPYLYLYYKGRMQSHVDVTISLCGALIFLIYVHTQPEMEYRWSRILLPLFLVLSTFVSTFYDSISSSDYYGNDIESHNDFCDENYEKYALMSDDKEHFYMIGANETNASFWCFPVFSVIKKSFYENIYRLNSRHVPSAWQPVSDRGYEDIWQSMVENEEVYYAATEVCNSHLDALNEYIQDHYCKSSRYTLVKEVDGLYIYSFDEGSVKLDLSDVIEDSTDVISKIETVNVDENGMLNVNGYAYVDGEDSFAQNIYVEIINKNTDSSRICYTLQTLNSLRKNQDKYHGKYSAFSAQINVSRYQDYEVNLIIESNGVLHRVSIGEISKN